MYLLSIRKRPPASKMSIMELDTIVFDKKDLRKLKSYWRIECHSTFAVKHTNCSICTANYKENDEGKKMPCKHVFHTDCLVEWLNQVSKIISLLFIRKCSNSMIEQFM